MTFLIVLSRLLLPPLFERLLRLILGVAAQLLYVAARRFVQWTPCTRCRQAKPGALRFVYVTVYVSETRVTYRLKLCRDCYPQLMADVEMDGESREDDGEWLTVEARVALLASTAAGKSGGSRTRTRTAQKST